MTFFTQFWAVFAKNFLMGWRSRELIYEVCLPLLTGVLMVVKNIIFPIQFLAPIIVALAINTSSRSLLIRLVEEKSNRYKEVQKIMGLSQTAYFSAWYISALLRTLFSAIFFLVLPFVIVTKVTVEEKDLDILKMGDYLGFWDILYNNERLNFLITYALYVVAATNQAFAISTVFSDAKLAGEVSTFITTLTSLFSFLVFSPGFTETPFQFILVSLSPQACIAFAYIAAVKNPIYHEGFDINNISYMVQYPIKDAQMQMATLIGFYLIIYLYLEAITPNEYGISSHPLLCISKLKRIRRSNNEEEQQQLQDEEPIDDQEPNLENLPEQELHDLGKSNVIQDTSSAIYHQEYTNLRNSRRTIQIKGLYKEYGATKAVNGVSLSLYNKNIFCLLGHNGAGKTTMISLLTGLVDKTRGSIKVHGKELGNNLRSIRKSLGICTQKEVLYEDMTFEEHLYFISKIKGIPRRKRKQEIEKVIEMTKTQDHRYKLSKQLSGGNKRKLSLCMALIGGSKVVFLDEPTSGIDAISRRAIWEILEYVRTEDRTIVLTTHHLDEAEVLADRIGIMAKGQLLAVGTNDFMKRNFGVGYTLSIYPNLYQQGGELAQQVTFSEQQKESIINMIEQKIPDAKLNPQSNMNSLIFMVSFSAQEHFVDLFEKLEKEQGFLINLEMNTLEDAFVNIGMDEDKFFKGNEDEQKNLNDIKDNLEHNVEAKYTYFEDIEKPECLQNPPIYKFHTQFFACFLRKYYCTIRNFTNYVSFFVPLMLMILAADVMKFTPEQGPGKLVLMGIFFAIAYSFNGGIYIVQPVQEREENLKYAMNVMGCRVAPFWLGTFAFDFTVYMLTVLIFIWYSNYQNHTFITKYAGQIWGIMTAFGFSLITFSYMCGYVLFQKSSSAMKGFPAINFFIVFILPWAILGVCYYLNFEDILDSPTQLLLEKVFILIYFLYSPLYVLALCFQFIVPPNTQENNFELPFYQYSEDKNFYIVILALQCIVFSVITYVLEQKKYNLSPKDKDKFKKLRLQKIQDEEVNNEKERVLKIAKAQRYKHLKEQNKGKNEDDDLEGALKQQYEDILNQEQDKIVVQNLWKKYDSNNYVAIKDVSYGVKSGEIFGLLGPNGAGKSTSFNILTSLIPRSMGSVSIKNIQVNRGIMKIYQDVGICPQFDCVWSSLSPREHLFLFGRMKGLVGKDLDQTVDYFMEVTQLNEFKRTKAGNLSGGNKRKLCVACALIGGPDIQFFDEPSTGVDPIARRFLWNTLKQGSKLRDSAIVLTTHTMLEAESLCTKIGILINGQFQCLGTPQQLRNKYGDGYTITVQGNAQDKELFTEKIQEQFPTLKELPEKRENYFAYQIGTRQFSFFKGYKVCNQLKQEGIIQDFSINQCTLEQVFVRFSKFQEVNPQL